MVSVLRASNFSVWELRYFLIIKHYYPPHPYFITKDQGIRAQVRWDWILNPRLNLIHLGEGAGDWEKQEKCIPCEAIRVFPGPTVCWT